VSDQQKDEGWRGKIGKMSPAEIDEFLAEPNLARLACLDDNGWPYAVACWYQWDGKALWLVPRAKSAWATYLEHEPRCAVTIDESSAADEELESGVQRRYVAQCKATIVEQPNVGGQWVEVARTMSIRYYGANGPAYLEPTMTWKRRLIRLDPLKTMTWQGIAWPKRYLEGDAVASDSTA
jgi:nitroimidazol reductase NimA-like FMN-containing flavoprotein (pyridoxamine 5'-phosphate oxidase superfamily)